MKISFDTIAESAIENFKGGEGTFHVHMFQDMNNKIMKGRLVPGSSIGTHTHETNRERWSMRTPKRSCIRATAIIVRREQPTACQMKAPKTSYSSPLYRNTSTRVVRFA